MSHQKVKKDLIGSEMIEVEEAEPVSLKVQIGLEEAEIDHRARLEKRKGWIGREMVKGSRILPVQRLREAGIREAGICTKE